jgi:hypothetical protein
MIRQPLLLILGLLVGCKKSELDALPPATQTGANTMGCLVDGKAWLPAPIKPGLLSGPPSNPIYARYQPSRYQSPLDLSFHQASKTSISIWVPNLQQTGTIHFNQTILKRQGNSTLFSHFYPYAMYSSHITYPTTYSATDSSSHGQLTITRLDTVKNTVSGTFAFTGRALDGATIEVTEGRFDVQFSH